VKSFQLKNARQHCVEVATEGMENETSDRFLGWADQGFPLTKTGAPTYVVWRAECTWAVMSSDLSRDETWEFRQSSACSWIVSYNPCNWQGSMCHNFNVWRATKSNL